jgi:hypothetical protein
VLVGDSSEFEELVLKTLEGKKEGDVENPTAAQDGENVLVLLNHLITNASELDGERKERYKTMLAKYTGLEPST